MSETPTARMLRLYCDGELSADQMEQIEQHLRAHPQDRARVEFERTLRQRVGAVMQAQCRSAPPELAGRIRDRLAEQTTEGGPQTSPKEVVGRVGGQPPDTPAAASQATIVSKFRGPRRANIFAVAASLALVAGAVLFGIFGPSIDDWRGAGSVDLAASAAPFVAIEHGRCAGSAQARANKATFHDPLVAGTQLSNWLGATVYAGPLTDRLSEQGWEFLGGGYCCVPVSERSVHLIFTRDDLTPDPAMLSIFIVPDDGRYAVLIKGAVVPVQPGEWYQLPPCEQFPRDVWIYSDGQLVYLMVTCLPDELGRAATALEQALTQAGR